MSSKIVLYRSTPKVVRYKHRLLLAEDAFYCTISLRNQQSRRMQRIEGWKTWTLLGAFIFLAVVINGTVDYVRLPRAFREMSDDGHPDTSPTSPSSAPAPSASAPAIHRKTPEELAQEHREFIARYVNPGFPKKSGQSVAISAVSEDRHFNNAVSAALAKRIKTATAKTVTGLFTPEFVSGGLFDEVFSGSTATPRNLELANFMDVLVLAKQTVEYSTDPALNDLVSAHMGMEILAIPLAPGAQSQSWTYKSDGAGFNRQTARSAAEERILVQLAKATNMDLSLSFESGR